MSRYVYVNGQYVIYNQARVAAEDRGFQFGDAVYEVSEVKDGRIVDETRHMDRLDRSLDELKITRPLSRPAWQRVLRETIRRNRLVNGSIYLQVSRGARPRDFFFPPAGTPPTVVVVARHGSPARANAKAEKGIAVKTMPDIRWARCDIKTVMLLPASLAKEAARSEGAEDAWFVDEKGFVTEGASANAWIVDKEGRLVTRQIDNAILRGVTRTTLLDLLKREGIEVVERAFTVDEAKAAREAFLTSATSLVTPVVRIDDATIGNGEPGMLSLKLRSAFHTAAEIAPS
jgi:D-alanine transaminase